jgi:hypothetical protein
MPKLSLCPRSQQNHQPRLPQPCASQAVDGLFGQKSNLTVCLITTSLTELKPPVRTVPVPGVQLLLLQRFFVMKAAAGMNPKTMICVPDRLQSAPGLNVISLLMLWLCPQLKTPQPCARERAAIIQKIQKMSSKIASLHLSTL